MIDGTLIIPEMSLRGYQVNRASEEQVPKMKNKTVSTSGTYFVHKHKEH